VFLPWLLDLKFFVTFQHEADFEAVVVFGVSRALEQRVDSHGIGVRVSRNGVVHTLSQSMC
jgi:hypothetical protein